MRQHHINLKTSSAYHPQENGKVEVTNIALERILTMVVSSSKKDWVERLVEVNWVYNTTWINPYDLVYGKKGFTSIVFEYNTLRMEPKMDLDFTISQQERLLQYSGLDEFRMKALLHNEVMQLQSSSMTFISMKILFKKDIGPYYMHLCSNILKGS